MDQVCLPLLAELELDAKRVLQQVESERLLVGQSCELYRQYLSNLKNQEKRIEADTVASETSDDIDAVNKKLQEAVISADALFASRQARPLTKANPRTASGLQKRAFGHTAVGKAELQADQCRSQERSRSLVPRSNTSNAPGKSMSRRASSTSCRQRRQQLPTTLSGKECNVLMSMSPNMRDQCQQFERDAARARAVASMAPITGQTRFLESIERKVFCFHSWYLGRTQFEIDAFALSQKGLGLYRDTDGVVFLFQSQPFDCIILSSIWVMNIAGTFCQNVFLTSDCEYLVLYFHGQSHVNLDKKLRAMEVRSKKQALFSSGCITVITDNSH